MGGFSEFDQNGFRKSSYLFLKSAHHVRLYFYKIEFKCKKLGKGNELKKKGLTMLHFLQFMQLKNLIKQKQSKLISKSYPKNQTRKKKQVFKKER